MTILREDVRRQLDLEAEALGLGAIRYRQERPLPWRRPEDNPKVDEEANLPPGKQLLRLAVEPTAALIREKLEAANTGKAGRRFSALGWLELADAEEVAYLAARVALNAAATQSSFQTATRTLAEHIISHIRMKIFKTKNPAGYVGLIRSAKTGRVSKNRATALKKLLNEEVGESAISVADRIHLGSMALELLIEATGLFVVEQGTFRSGATGYVVRATETVRDWLEKQHARCEILDPLHMPMVVRPRRWRAPTGGGYLRSQPPRRLIKADSTAYQASLNGADLSLVYEAVNHIQETPWRINKAVLEIMREVWDSGGTIAGLPERHDRSLPAKPADIETSTEALLSWKRAAALVYEHNAAEESRRLVLQQRLWIAERFSGEDAIWFPHSLDFRGRAYPIPSAGIHPQADDGGKALLEFAHGLPLGPTGGYWLAVHIANLFGVDKVSFADRVAWTYAHSEQLIDSALNPLDGQRFWTEADDPWLALAATFDFAGFLKDGERHVSHLPIPLDGSNSGLQHFSALLRDPIGAAAVNLIPNMTPQDVYTSVATVAQAIADATDDPAAEPWKGGKITRAVTKRPTMTFVYSATRFGMQDMVLGALGDIDMANAQRGLPPHLGGADNYEAARWLSHVLFEAISAVVAAASAAMSWLRSVAKVAASADRALQWTTPDGLPVLQSYRETFGRRLEVHWQGRLIKVTLATEGSRLDARGQANGVAPNFVHSLDAAHLRAVARGAKAAGIDYLAVIHDSFGTHAARTDDLVRVLRETFVAQYSGDILADFRREVLAQLPPELADQIKPAPPRGALDLEEVRRAPYLFA